MCTAARCRVEGQWLQLQADPPPWTATAHYHHAVTRPLASSKSPPPPPKVALLPVRLSGSDSPLEGRLEVETIGGWGTVSNQQCLPAHAPAAAARMFFAPCRLCCQDGLPLGFAVTSLSLPACHCCRCVMMAFWRQITQRMTPPRLSAPSWASGYACPTHATASVALVLHSWLLTLRQQQPLVSCG